MRFLTYGECSAWCAERGYPTRQRISGAAEPDLRTPPYHFAEFPLPTDSGRKVGLARFLYSLLDPTPELLLWLDDWAVWPSSGHMPMFTRFRQACGECRPLIEAPGHLITPDEADDAISILVVSLQFVWNCHVFTASGQDAVFISHDEYGWFASRDESVANAAQDKLHTARKEVPDKAWVAGRSAMVRESGG